MMMSRKKEIKRKRKERYEENTMVVLLVHQPANTTLAMRTTNI